MGKTLRLLFNLHPGEAQKASLFIFLGLLWSMGGYGVLVLSEGMFLQHVGTNALPSTYLIIALCMCSLSTILIYALNRISIRLLLFSLILAWSLSILTFATLYSSYGDNSIYWYFFKIVVWMIPISTYIVYWAFADQYFDLQDGKRFFCLFNSITFLGDALGGGSTSFLLNYLKVSGLMLLFASCLLASLPFILIITKRLQPVLEEHSESIDSTSSINLFSILRSICKSKFTLYLIVFYFSMQLLAIVTEFNYMKVFETTFHSSSDNSLTEFIGSCGMWISLGNMFFGMFIYSRFVKKLGVNNIVLIAPAIFFGILSVWLFKEALPIAVFGMIAREGIVYSLDDNNLNLLLSGVPIKIKNQVRITIESFIEPTGMFAAALLLLLYKSNAHLLGFLISFAALGIVLFLRSHYPKAIFKNLVATSICFEKTANDYLKKFSPKERAQTEFLLLSHLKKHSEKEQLIAYEYLLKIGQKRVLPRLLNHVGKLSLPSKLKAIELLNKSEWAGQSMVLERLESWRRTLPHSTIKSKIHFYLAQHGALRPERVLQDLQHAHLGLRAAAIFTLKTNPNAPHFPTYCSLASDKLSQLLESEKESEICMALYILGLEKKAENMELLFPFLSHASLTINRAASEAIAKVAHREHKSYASKLISLLQNTRDSQMRQSYLQALELIADTDSLEQLILASMHFRPSECKYIEKIAFHSQKKSALTLLKLLQNCKIPEKCRLLSGKILGTLDLKFLNKNLDSIAHQEIKRAYFYYYHAHTIQKHIPEHDLTLLQKALFTSYDSVIDFLIQLLGVAEALEESEILSYTLRSANRKVRAQAIESLEKTCNSRIFALLEPLIKEENAEKRVLLYLKNGGLPLNLTQLLETLSHSASRANQIIAITMKAQLKTPGWQQIVREKLDQEDTIFHHFVHELLEGYAHA